MRFDVLVLIVVVGLVIVDYTLANGFYSAKVLELVQHIYAGFTQR